MCLCRLCDILIILSLVFYLSPEIVEASQRKSRVLSQAKLARPQNHREDKHCSIHQSATVRKILSEDFFPVFEVHGFKVPAKCPFNTKRDVFHVLESNKTYLSSARWKCELCGKVFYTEYYLDKHFLRKHNDLISKGEDSICLADYCDIFRCDLHQQYPEVPDNVHCNDKTVIGLQRSCEKLLRLCLPDEDTSHRVYDLTSTSICSTLTCEKFLVPFQDSFSVWTIVLIAMAVPGGLFGLAALCFHVLDSIEDEEDVSAVRQRLHDQALYENTYEHVRKLRGSKLRHRNVFLEAPDALGYNRSAKKGRYYRKVLHERSPLGIDGSMLDPVDSNPRTDWISIDMS